MTLEEAQEEIIRLNDLNTTLTNQVTTLTETHQTEKETLESSLTLAQTEVEAVRNLNNQLFLRVGTSQQQQQQEEQKETEMSDEDFFSAFK